MPLNEQQQLTILETTWKSIDSNKSGKIEFEEFLQFMGNRNVTNRFGKVSISKCREIFDKIDINDSGKIEITEFIRHVSFNDGKAYLDFLNQ